MTVNRSNLAERQAQMTATWYENVKKTHGDVDRYIATRHEAYLGRWKESARFIKPGNTVLDIGGGNLFPSLVEYLKALEIDYHYLDIDPSAVEGAKDILQRNGFNPAQANFGFNDSFLYPNDMFDAIFSSHCIEHSIALPQTLSELNRLIKTGGYLLMAVPFGWEENPEHPYFFDPDQWLALIEDAGFEIRIAQIGREYPESGADFFIAARKVRATQAPRIDVSTYTKTTYEFVQFSKPHIEYQGNAGLATDGISKHLRGDDWVIRIELPSSATEVLPIMLRHNWSGQVQLSNELGQRQVSDLYNWFPYLGVLRLGSPFASAFRTVELRCVGRNPASFGSEGIFYGYMWR